MESFGIAYIGFEQPNSQKSYLFLVLPIIFFRNSNRPSHKSLAIKTTRYEYRNTARIFTSSGKKSCKRWAVLWTGHHHSVFSTWCEIFVPSIVLSQNQCQCVTVCHAGLRKEGRRRCYLVIFVMVKTILLNLKSFSTNWISFYCLQFSCNLHSPLDYVSDRIWDFCKILYRRSSHSSKLFSV
jgi:hypothetical protein